MTLASLVLLLALDGSASAAPSLAVRYYCALGPNTYEAVHDPRLRYPAPVPVLEPKYYFLDGTLMTLEAGALATLDVRPQPAEPRLSVDAKGTAALHTGGKTFTIGAIDAVPSSDDCAALRAAGKGPDISKAVTFAKGAKASLTFVEGKNKSRYKEPSLGIGFGGWETFREDDQTFTLVDPAQGTLTLSYRHSKVWSSSGKAWTGMGYVVKQVAVDRPGR